MLLRFFFPLKASHLKPPSLHPNRELLAVNNQYPLGQQTGRAERCHIFCKYTFNHTATFIPCDSPCKKPLLSIISKLPQCVCISVLILHGNRVITSHKRLIFFPCPVDFQYTFLQKIGAFLIRHQYPTKDRDRTTGRIPYCHTFQSHKQVPPLRKAPCCDNHPRNRKS